MTVRFHRLVQQDVWQAIRFYEAESGKELADAFYREFIHLVRKAENRPERFHFDLSGLKRAPLERFPYHFLYRIRDYQIFVLVLRHNSRHPSFGLRRNR